jgi:hypothetical protein
MLGQINLYHRRKFTAIINIFSVLSLTLQSGINVKNQILGDSEHYLLLKLRSKVLVVIILHIGTESV